MSFGVPRDAARPPCGGVPAGRRCPGCATGGADSSDGPPVAPLARLLLQAGLLPHPCASGGERNGWSLVDAGYRRGGGVVPVVPRRQQAWGRGTAAGVVRPEVRSVA